MNRKVVAVLATAVILGVAAVTGISATFDGAVMALKQGHYEAAKPRLESLATVGHSGAQRLLGEVYAFGWGVPRDREKAIKWFRRAAYRSEGLKDPAAYAAYYVGENFSQGLGVQQNGDEAAWWMQFAKDGGYSGGPRQ